MLPTFPQAALIQDFASSSRTASPQPLEVETRSPSEQRRFLASGGTVYYVQFPARPLQLSLLSFFFTHFFFQYEQVDR